jgi:hypothetical protein
LEPRMNEVPTRTRLLSARVRVPHPRFLRVGLLDLTKLGLRQTEQS